MGLEKRLIRICEAWEVKTRRGRVPAGSERLRNLPRSHGRDSGFLCSSSDAHRYSFTHPWNSHRSLRDHGKGRKGSVCADHSVVPHGCSRLSLPSLWENILLEPILRKIYNPRASTVALYMDGF